jgi:hypothetical protein
MDDDDYYVTLETDDEGCRQLSFELPADTPPDQVAYFRTLLVREELGSIELVDPDTHEVVYFLRPALLH